MYIQLKWQIVPLPLKNSAAIVLEAAKYPHTKPPPKAVTEKLPVPTVPLTSVKAVKFDPKPDGNDRRT